MLTEPQAKSIKNIPEWDVFEAHFKDCIRLLDSVSDIEEHENHEVIARGKKYAIRLMERILAPFDIEDLLDEDARAEAYEKIGMHYVSPKNDTKNE